MQKVSDNYKKFFSDVIKNEHVKNGNQLAEEYFKMYPDEKIAWGVAYDSKYLTYGSNTNTGGVQYRTKNRDGSYTYELNGRSITTGKKLNSK